MVRAKPHSFHAVLVTLPLGHENLCKGLKFVFACSSRISSARVIFALREPPPISASKLPAQSRDEDTRREGNASSEYLAWSFQWRNKQHLTIQPRSQGPFSKGGVKDPGNKVADNNIHTLLEHVALPLYVETTEMDDAGDSMNENFESSFHSNLTNMSSSQGEKRPKYPKTARVFVVDDSSSCDELLQFHRSKYAFKMNYIGIDCEWVNKEGQVNAPVALLQIATPLCDCFLVRLCKMDGQMPQIVKEILEDKTVLKFGVGIQNDARRLLEMFGIHARGCVDLRHVAQRIQFENGDQRFVTWAQPFFSHIFQCIT